MSLNLAKTVAELLKNRPEQRTTAREIAEWIFKTYPQQCQEKKDRSESIQTDADLIQQIAAEIGAQRPRLQQAYPQIKTTEGRPRRYYYTEKSDQAEVAESESESEMSKVAEPGVSYTDSPARQKLREHDLYLLLANYLHSELGLNSKRIDEKRSSNQRGPNGNKWLYPDVVALEDLSRDWHPEVKRCVHEYFDKKSKLWSFEVKLLINRSNVRETYFQAVSNSSWTNYGYLVAAEIAEDESMSELRMLYSVHGIGVIELNVENPSESQILIPAVERPKVNWHNCNRLANENKDFLDYIKLVRHFYQTVEKQPASWDLATTETS
jgi:hypothetical protein